MSDKTKVYELVYREPDTNYYTIALSLDRDKLQEVIDYVKQTDIAYDQHLEDMFAIGKTGPFEIPDDFPLYQIPGFMETENCYTDMRCWYSKSMEIVERTLI